MTVETIWSRLTRIVLMLVMAAAVLLVAVWYLPLIKQNAAMREQQLRLEGDIQQEEEKTRQRKAEIEALRNDPAAVERLARERLGLAKPGETVVHFEAGIATNEVKPPPTTESAALR